MTDDAMAVGIDHVQLAMPAGEEGRAESFYQGLLAIPRVPKPEHLAKRGGCWFEGDGIKVHLGVEEGFRPARKAHPALLVDDLEQFIERCREEGVEMDLDQPALDGYRRAHVYDPFGNRVELMEKISAGPIV